MTDIEDCDAVVLAVAHSDFATLTMEQFDGMFKAEDNSRRVLIDIKGILNRKEYETAGYIYWRL